MLSYREVKKDGKCFTSMRAVGLAIEQAHKIGKSRAWNAVTEHDLSSVRLSGDLQVKDSSGWYSEDGSVRVKVEPADAAYALDIFKCQCRFFTQHGFNAWSVDANLDSTSQGAHDLVGCWPVDSHWVGKCSVELKVSTQVNSQLDGWQKKAVRRFNGLPGTFGSMLLLVCEAKTLQDGSWARPLLCAWLYHNGSWQVVRSKPVDNSSAAWQISSVLDKLTWHNQPRSRVKVALANHFMKAIGLTAHCLSERVKTWNKALRADSKIQLSRVRFLPGKPAWVGTKAAFAHILKYVRQKKVKN